MTSLYQATLGSGSQPKFFWQSRDPTTHFCSQNLCYGTI